MIKTHITLDFYQAEPQILAMSEDLKKAINNSLKILDLEVKQDSYIQFEPQGVTATVVGENFHFSIHTWPEHGSCAIDLYSSSDYAFARTIADALKEAFKAQEYDIKVLDRSHNK